MKLVRFTDTYQQNRVGVLEGDLIYATTWTGDMLSLLRSGIRPQVTSVTKYLQSQVKLQSPYIPPKIICIGRNYADHAAEMGNSVPEAPFLFGKFSSSVIGHGDDIRWSTHLTEKVDWKVSWQ